MSSLRIKIITYTVAIFLLFFIGNCLQNADLGSNVHSILIGRNSDISLLLTVGSDQSVDVVSVNFVHLLDGILDLFLVGSGVNEENQSVAVLHLLHSSFGGDGVLNNGVLQHFFLVKW
jgi:hypothetical protein